MARRGYTAEFRRRVGDLVEGGRKVSEVATELGVSQQTIYVWRRQARIDAGLEAGVTTSELAGWSLGHTSARRLREPSGTRGPLHSRATSGRLNPERSAAVDFPAAKM